jgi:hypothetical protein
MKFNPSILAISLFCGLFSIISVVWFAGYISIYHLGYYGHLLYFFSVAFALASASTFQLAFKNE